MVHREVQGQQELQVQVGLQEVAEHLVLVEVLELLVHQVV